MSLNKGDSFKMIMSDFRNLDYEVQYKVLNAANYGVPQTRERVIIVGVSKDIDFVYEYPKPTNSKDGSDGLLKWLSVGEALKDIPDPDQPNNVFNHTYSKYKLNINGCIGVY